MAEEKVRVRITKTVESDDVRIIVPSKYWADPRLPTLLKRALEKVSMEEYPPNPPIIGLDDSHSTR